MRHLRYPAPLVAVVASLAFCASVRADTTISDLRNLNQSGDTQLAAETKLAVNYWRARNVTACPTGISSWLAEFPDYQAESGLDCALYMDGRTIAAARADTRHYNVDAQNENECALVMHGVGHAMGLEHTASGVMGVPVEAPWECRVFARDLARAHAPAKRSTACRDRRRGARRACRSTA